MVHGRAELPETDFRPKERMLEPAEINYHEDFVNNRNGYENFMGLLHYYGTRKFLFEVLDPVLKHET